VHRGAGPFWAAAALALALVAVPVPGWSLRVVPGTLVLERSTDGGGSWSAMSPTSPGNILEIGDQLKITFTLENNTGQMGNMKADDTNTPPTAPGKGLNPPEGSEINVSASDGCTQNLGLSDDLWPGQYWVWPRMGGICYAPMPSCAQDANCPNELDLSAPLNLVSATDVTTFDYNGYTYASGTPNNTQPAVTWIFEAKREWEKLDFDVFGLNIDDEGNYCECAYGAPYPSTPTPGPGDGCSFANSPKNPVREGTYIACQWSPAGGCPPPDDGNVLGDSTMGEILLDPTLGFGGTIKIVSVLKTHSYPKVLDPGSRPTGLPVSVPPGMPGR